MFYRAILAEDKELIEKAIVLSSEIEKRAQLQMDQNNYKATSSFVGDLNSNLI